MPFQKGHKLLKKKTVLSCEMCGTRIFGVKPKKFCHPCSLVRIEQQSIQYRMKNREKILLATRQRRRDPEHRKKQAEWNRLWVKRNPERARFIRARQQRLRVARIKTAAGTFTFDDWERIKKDANYRCVICLSGTEKLTVDHIVPLSLGGTNYPSNIQPLCHRCNARKGNRIIGQQEIV